MSLPVEAVHVPMGCVGASGTVCHVPMSVHECVCVCGVPAADWVCTRTFVGWHAGGYGHGEDLSMCLCEF